MLHRGWIHEKEFDRIQQYEEEEDPRFSRAHVLQGRQERPEPPQGQGPEKACRLNREKAGKTRVPADGFSPAFHEAWTDVHSAEMSGFGRKGIIWPSMSRGRAAIRAISPSFCTGIHRGRDAWASRSAKRSETPSKGTDSRDCCESFTDCTRSSSPPRGISSSWPGRSRGPGGTCLF